MTSILWTDEHAPLKISDVAGNDDAKETVRKWALEIQRARPKRPLLLHGPPGTGKTALVHALANEMGWTLVESGGSDIRTADAVERLAGFSSSGLFGKRLLVFDEIDSAFDRGEIPALAKILKEASGPVIVVANDLALPKLAPVKLLCEKVEFKRISNSTIRGVIERIVEKQGVKCAFVDKIIENTKGDLRSAINDLQAACDGGNPDFSVAVRDRKGDLQNALKTVFKTMSFSEAASAADSIDEELDTFTLWIAENVPYEYEDPKEVSKSMHWISRADVFQGRVRRRQDYSLLKYARALGLAGVALSKKQPYSKFIHYNYPTPIRLYGMSKRSRQMMKSISLKIGRALHVSSYEARKAVPFIAILPGASKYFEFSEEEEDLLKEMNKS